MDRAGLVTEIRNKLGYNTGLSESLIVSALDDAQDMLEELPELPWFLETDFVTLSTVAGDERVSVPSDFIREINENAMWLYDAASGSPYKELPKSDMVSLRNWYNGKSGVPEAYALQGEYFRIFPEPDGVYDLRIIYYAKQPKLVGASSVNKWSTEAPQTLVGQAGLLLAENNRDEKALQVFTGILNRAITRLSVRSEAREHAGQIYLRGGLD